MATVSLRNIHKTFGKTEVVHGIDCEIDNGEFVVLLGPSGCGKSTVLRMIAGLETVSRGEIKIGDQVVNELEPAARDIAMVFQNYALYPHMNVAKNMAYGLKIRGMSKQEIDKRVNRAAEILELTPYLNRKPRQLSGGQRQRVAMGRCIVREPKVFLFDEPLSNLDAKLRVQMRLELRNLHEKLGITSIYVTHDQVEAMTLGNRLMVINEGRAEQIGSPLAVYEQPNSLFVASFIGSPAMNFLKAKLTNDNQTVQLPDGACIDLPGRVRSDAKSNEIVLGIRPEHFQPTDASDAKICLDVDHVETLGADTLVHGRLSHQSDPLTIRLTDVHHFDRHHRLKVKVAPERLHVFAPETGNRMVIYKPES